MERKEGFDVKIGYRTLKTAVGAPIAIWIAQIFGFTNFITAGILTILSIQPSRKRSFMSAWQRFFACLLGILYSLIFFNTLGYHSVSIGILLLLFIPVTVYFKITEGIVTSSVIVLNLYSTGKITMAFVGEQLFIILIGIGTALLLNIYMPSLDNKLKEKQMMLEKNFQKILYEISQFIREENLLWDGKEMIKAEEILVDALTLVAVDKENNLLRYEHSYDDYFHMREKQLRSLQKMLPLVSRIHNVEGISPRIANFFEELSNAVHPGNTAIVFLEQLEELREIFSKKELPTTREDFETRANLYRLLHEIEEYLTIKSKYKKSDMIHMRNERKSYKN